MHSRAVLASVFCALAVALLPWLNSTRDHQIETQLSIAQALPAPLAGERRIGIVHSAVSAENFWDQFSYNQLFAATQHQAMMAGLPFDLLTEDSLMDAALLNGYDAILMPSLAAVQQTNRAAIVANLSTAQQNGVALITASDFLVADQNGKQFKNPATAMQKLLGLQAASHHKAVPATIRVATNTHPAMQNYTLNEALHNYDATWFGHFIPVENQQSTVLTQLLVDGSAYTGAQALTRNGGRVVHFASAETMADNNLLWSVLQWAVYGDVAPVALQVSRSNSVFVARNDMDQAMIAAELADTAVPLLDLITQWKAIYNFVGSYYINIGDNPGAGEYTDWDVSAPLYRKYIALGNEIGTHTWTHPDNTSSLSDARLDFEFNQSAQKIAAETGTPVRGAAVPGMAENLNVIENTNQWFDYLSGRSGNIGSGFQSAIGFLEPQHNMLYFSPNMSPDYTLVNDLQKTPAQAHQNWVEQIDHLHRHAQQPVLHWLWHDYGPTTGSQPEAIDKYSVAMFEDTLRYAAGKRAEFTTLSDLNDRIRTFAASNLSVTADGTINATVNAAGVGQFSLKIQTAISSVDNWYAYSGDRVFLPDNGGSFAISTGDTTAPVTRISALPMRARLLSVDGDGTTLAFQFTGEGDIHITVNPVLANNIEIQGADNWQRTNTGVILSFSTHDTYRVVITPRTQELIDADTIRLADSADHCPAVARGDHSGSDSETIGTVCGAPIDSDSDTIADSNDNCPTIANTEQRDTDGDGTGDACHDLTAYYCNGLPATIVGTTGVDKILGTRNDDVIVGLGGDDKIWGRGGNDVICGNDGNDTIKGGSGNDEVYGNNGTDTLYGNRGNDYMSGGDNKDHLYGGNGHDLMDGGSGEDICSGSNGRDAAENCALVSAIN